MVGLSDFKRGRTVDARMAKNRWIILCSDEYCLESEDSFSERRKNLLTEIKLWKKAKAVW